MFIRKQSVIFIPADVTAETCTFRTETDGKYNVITLWQLTAIAAIIEGLDSIK